MAALKKTKKKTSFALTDGDHRSEKVVCCPFLFSVQWTSGQWGASWQNSSLEGPCFPARTVSFAIFQRAAQSCRGCLDAVSFTNQTG